MFYLMMHSTHFLYGYTASDIWKSHVHSWYDRSLDQFFMVNPLSYFLFQPVLHDWCNKGNGMCYSVCGMIHIKELFLLIRNSSPSYLNGPLLYNRI